MEHITDEMDDDIETRLHRVECAVLWLLDRHENRLKGRARHNNEQYQRPKALGDHINNLLRVGAKGTLTR